MLIVAWLGAIAAAILAVGAGFTIYYAKQAFEKQSTEVRLVEKQAEARCSDAADRRAHVMSAEAPKQGDGQVPAT